MRLFKLLGQDTPKHDPYWEFNEQSQFRPKLNNGDFYKLSGFDFGWFVLKPITEFINGQENEIEKGKSLSYLQKALYYWWYVDGQITNGGFVQFYYNGYDKYIPTIIKGLLYIGDNEMVSLIQKADKIYQKNKRIFYKTRKIDYLWGNLYERVEEMSALDKVYYGINTKTMSAIEKYIRENPNEICLDEVGNEFDTSFTGVYNTFYAENKIKENFTLENGIINGEFKSFYENGQIREQLKFINGEQTGEKNEYYENGNKKYSVQKNSQLNQFEHFWYYENGNPKKLEHKLLTKDERIGEFKEWYENGQLAKKGTYISNSTRDGSWLEFYEDGSKKLEAEFKNEDFLVQNYWNERGEQILINGTGLYINLNDGWDRRSENEYKNYKKHGLQKTFSNGVLRLCQEMENGKENGYSWVYYTNGKVKNENLYKDGELLSKHTYPISDKPVGKVSFQFLMKEEWLKSEGLPFADTYPVCINENEIRQIIKIPKLLFELEHQDLEGATCLWLSVNENGNVTDAQFRSAYMTNGEEFFEVVNKMKFLPATKDGENVASFIYIIATFTVE